MKFTSWGFAPLLFLLLSAPAFAEECGWNSDHSFWSCDGPTYAASAGGGAPTISDSLDNNPASLPTDETPFGLEGMYSNRAFPDAKGKFSASTVKGFEGVGFGIGSWSEGTFGAPDFPAHFFGTGQEANYKEYEANPPGNLGLRLGSSVKLPKKWMPKGTRLSFGLSLGQGRTRGDWAPQAGVLLKVHGLAVGFSQSYEKLSNLLPRVTVSDISVGIPYGPFYFGYSHFILSSSADRTTANVFALRFTKNRWTLFGNLKTQLDHRGEPDAWHRAGIQRRIGKRFGLGYEYGLYRYSHSLILQLFL